MNRVFGWLAAALTGAALVGVLALGFDGPTTRPADSPLAADAPAGWRTAPATPALNELVRLPEAPATASAPNRWPHFPIGTPVPVEVGMDTLTRDRLTVRERDDQVRDWLLTAAVSDAGLTADQLNRALFDLPPVRFGHFRPVAQFEYGPTRVRHLPADEVLALVPAGQPPAERTDHLAHIADEARKTLGKFPATVQVFEYTLAPDAAAATVTRVGPLPGPDLFTADYGYVSATVSTLKEFEAFMAQVDDLTVARHATLGLELSGRKLAARTYGRMAVADVAAVWQAQKKIEDEYERVYEGVNREFREEQGRVKAKWDAKLKALNARLHAEPDKMTPAELAKQYQRGEITLNEYLEKIGKLQPKSDPLDRFGRKRMPKPDPDDPFGGLFVIPKPTDDDEPADGPLTQDQYDVAAAKLQKGFEAEADALQPKYQQLMRERVQAIKSPDHTGFSLDPEYDYAGLADYFEKEVQELLAKVVKKDEREKVAAALRARDPRPFLILTNRLRKDGDFLTKLAADELSAAARKRFQYQAARYDGDLAGTEVGMTLFYTDLLAKLWSSVGYDPPKKEVPEFRTSTDGGTAPIYLQQTLDTPGTRLWFGKEDTGYQLTADAGLLFARRATRIFAASSSDLTKHNEVPPIQSSVQTLGWWNDHYEEIARYEPQYERLNEYLKWSLVISWLVNDKKLDRMNFLSQVSVSRSAWFPEWVTRHPELRYAGWDRWQFHPKGHLGVKTETMPLLFSELYANFGNADKSWTTSGGVSGGRPLDFRTMPKLSADTFRTPGVSAGRGLKVDSVRPDKLTTVLGSVHEFSATDPKTARMLATPDSKLPLQPLQSVHGQFQPGTRFDRQTTLSGDGLRVETTARTQAGERPIGEFVAGPTPNGFRVRYTCKELDAAAGVGRELSASRRPAAEFLIDHPTVSRCIDTPDGALVQFHGSPQYYRFAPESGRTAVVPDGVDARVADTRAGAVSYQVTAVPAGEVLGLSRAGPGSYVQIPLGGRPVIGTAGGPPPVRGPPTVTAGGSGGKKPPPDSRKTTIHDGNERIPGEWDGQNLWIKASELPEGWKANPDRLCDLGRLSRPTGDALTLPPARATHRAIELAEQGKVAEAFKEFERNPAGLAEARTARREEVLETATKLSAAGRTVEAAEILARGRRAVGDTPEMRLQDGLNQLVQGHGTDAARALNESLNRPLAERPTFIDEVGRRVARLHPEAAERVAHAARADAARDLKVAGKTAADVTFVGSGSGVRIEAKLPAAEARPGGATAKDVLDPTHTVYIDDAVKVGGSPTAAPSRAAAHEAIGGGTAQLFELHAPDAITRVGVDRLTVGRLKTPAGERAGAGFRSAAPSPGRPPTAVYYHRPGGGPPGGGNGAAGGGGSGGGGDDEDVYWEDRPEPPSAPVRRRTFDLLPAVAAVTGQAAYHLAVRDAIVAEFLNLSDDPPAVAPPPKPSPPVRRRVLIVVPTGPGR